MHHSHRALQDSLQVKCWGFLGSWPKHGQDSSALQWLALGPNFGAVFCKGSSAFTEGSSLSCTLVLHSFNGSEVWGLMLASLSSWVSYEPSL